MRFLVISFETKMLGVEEDTQQVVCAYIYLYIHIYSSVSLMFFTELTSVYSRLLSLEHIPQNAFSLESCL